MGADRLWRSAGPRLLDQGPRILWAGTAVAERENGRDSARVKIFLYFIGKPKDPHANAMAQDFLERAARYVPAEMREIRPERLDLWSRHPAARKIMMDPAGSAMDSAGFTRLIANAQMEGRDLV